MQRFGEARLKKELQDRGLPTTGDRSVLAVRLHNFIYPGGLDEATVAHPVSSSTPAQAAPAVAEVQHQAIVPLTSEQSVTFGSEDAAPGTPVATASADGPEPQTSPSTKEIIATMTEGAKDACVSRRLRQQHPALYKKLLTEEVAYMSAEERRQAQKALDVYVPARC